MVYYRKYRPQTINELDNDTIRESLYSILSSAQKDQSIPHAFLFTGPKGLGKTSTARIVAKAVNCEEKNQESRIRNKGKDKVETLNSKFIIPNSREIEPCNHCSQCLSITNGSNIDVLEIDGASNRGIDEIRDLREKIRLLPAYAAKKVYIIDEVHMLTTEAFNALLKTLEEPPSHAMLILCTTELQKVPETISSRCLHISFTKAKDEELKRSLSRIIKNERIDIDDEAILSIASLSDGSFRDGTKILEELVFLAKGKQITKALVEEKYQISNIKYQILEITSAMAEKDLRKALGLVSKLTEQGMDMKYFIEQMINVLHEELLKKLGVEKNQESGIRNQELRIEEIKKLVELLSMAHADLKYAVLPQLPLEMAIIEWVTYNNLQTAQDTQVPSASENQEIKSDQSGSLKNRSSESSEYSDKWEELLKRVKTHNHSIAGVLRSCLLREYSHKEVIIEASYKFHKEKLEEKKTLEILEKAWQEMTGNRLKIMIELKK